MSTRPVSSAQRPTVPPAGRYGREPSPGRRRAVLGVGAVLVAAALAWVVWAGLGQAQVDARVTAVGFRVVDDGRVDVTYDVGKDPSSTVVCSLRALDQYKTAVGIAEVRVGPASERVTRRTDSVRTSALAVTGIAEGCRAV